ncbi:MAG: methionyl-tRNA formyltransferase [Burkholderiaceae bacterium]
MKIVFAGTPDFAAVALDAIVAASSSVGWTVPLVLTQPDRPAGRGLKLAPSAVKRVAIAHRIAVHTPVSLRKGHDALAAQATLRDVGADVLVVAAYGLILPPEILDIPRGLPGKWSPKLSALNIHASLLPRWRGAAPAARAIEAGDVETGITIMQMDAGLDKGPMLLAETIPIDSDDTAATLTTKLSHVGARLIVDALRNVDQLVATPQGAGATYAPKLNKSEALLDWSAPAVELERKVRAFDPFPVASSSLKGTTIRLWRCRAISAPALARSEEIGIVRAADKAGVRVVCGDGELLVTELQRAGGKRVNASEFLAGFAVNAGDRFAGSAAVIAE